MKKHKPQTTPTTAQTHPLPPPAARRLRPFGQLNNNNTSNYFRLTTFIVSSTSTDNHTATHTVERAVIVEKAAGVGRAVMAAAHVSHPMGEKNAILTGPRRTKWGVVDLTVACHLLGYF